MSTRSTPPPPRVLDADEIAALDSMLPHCVLEVETELEGST